MLLVVTGAAFASPGYPKLFGGEGKQPPQFLTRLYGPNFPAAVERGGPEKFAKSLENLEVPSPLAAAIAAGVAEFVGGLALILGFKTRLAALGIIAIMAVAIRKVHWSKGFSDQGGYELPLQFLATSATLFLTGPGTISLDGLSGREERKAKQRGVDAAAEA